MIIFIVAEEVITKKKKKVGGVEKVFKIPALR